MPRGIDSSTGADVPEDRLAALQRAGVTLAWGAATDIGRRAENQDSHLAQPPVFAVADGMGGHAEGAQASATLVEWLGRVTGELTADTLRQAVREADQHIREVARAAGNRQGMGTTVAGVAVVETDRGPAWAVFHMGDSRAYLLAEGRLSRISTDHSVVQELVDGGMITEADAVDHPQRHLITRALGVGPPSEADLTLLPIHPGERFLLCSDGLTGELRDDELADLLGAADDPETVAKHLVAAAVDRGASDNVTAVVVDVLPAA